MCKDVVCDDASTILPIVRKVGSPDGLRKVEGASKKDFKERNKKLIDYDYEYEAWLEKEKNVFDEMSDRNLSKSIRTLNRKKKFNKLMRYLHLPFYISCGKETDEFEDFMAEYLLRLHSPLMKLEENGIERIQYDLYRGLKAPELQLDMDTYSRIRDENKHKEGKEKPWYKRTFEKMFRKQNLLNTESSLKGPHIRKKVKSK